MNLSNDVAGLAGDSWCWQDYERLTRSDRERSKCSQCGFSRADFRRAASRATQAGFGRTDGEVDMTVAAIGPDIVIANDAETVVQQTGGNADIETFTQLLLRSAFPFHFISRVCSVQSDEPNKRCELSSLMTGYFFSNFWILICKICHPFFAQILYAHLVKLFRVCYN